MEFINKVFNAFKNKTFLRWFTVGVSALIIVTTTLGVILPSYLDWKTYYDSAISDLEHRKYVAGLPLDCLSLEAKLNEGVVYYANGRARPESGDFSVVGRFSERGNDFEKILQPYEYSVKTDADFAKNGGKVTVCYDFVSAAKEGETPETKRLVAEVACTLEKVVPVSISRTGAPYKIYYGNDTAFNGEGMTATVTFNDGSAETVGNDEFSYSNANLATGTEKVAVTWTRGDASFPFECPVTVVDSADYDEGVIRSVAFDETIYVRDGENTSQAAPRVIGTYTSGNRKVIEKGGGYVLTCNENKGSFDKQIIFTATLADDSAVSVKAPAVVEKTISAESASLTSAAFADVKESRYVDGEYVTASETLKAAAPVSGSAVTFEYTGNTVSKPYMSLRAALKPSESMVSVDLNKAITVYVNGFKKELPQGISLTQVAGEQTLYVFNELGLTSPLLLNKKNEIKLVFGEGAEKLVIGGISLTSDCKGEFFKDTVDYFAYNAQTRNTSAEYATSVQYSDTMKNDISYGLDMDTDGTYLYLLGTNLGNGTKVNVIKYDVAAKRPVAEITGVEKMIPGLDIWEFYAGDNASDYFTGITYYDGKVIIYMSPDGGGKQYYVDADTFSSASVFTEYTEFGFAEVSLPREVKFNRAQQKFAVLDNTRNSKVFVYGANKELLLTFDPIELDESPATHVSVSDDYIFVTYNNGGGITPYICAYDWEGNMVGNNAMSIPMSQEVHDAFNDPEKKIFMGGLAAVDGDFYISLIAERWNNNFHGNVIVKVSMANIDGKRPKADFDEYLESCISNGVAPVLSGVPSSNTPAWGDVYGAVKHTRHTPVGAVAVGDTVYVTSNTDGDYNHGHEGFLLQWFSQTDFRYKGEGAPTVIENDKVTSGDNSYLFVKDNVIYVVCGDVYSIPLSEVKNECKPTVDAEMTKLLTDGGKRVLKAAYWNETNRNYIVLENGPEAQGSETANRGGNVLILDEEGKTLKTITPSPAAGFYTCMATADDRYVYVSYTKELSSVANETFSIDVYDYNGEKVTSINVKDVTFGEQYGDNDKYSVQSVYFYNGGLHAVVANVGRNQVHDWTLNCDLSVFGA